MIDTSGVLSEEIKFFNQNKKEYLKTNKGQFVLIKGDQLVGFFVTEEEAYIVGIERFGNEPFLIKQVVEKDEEISFPALMVGVINVSLQ